MAVSRRVIGGLVALAIALVASATGAYFAFFSPTPTKVTVSVAAQATLGTDEPRQIKGTISPAEGGRLVFIEIRSGKGEWNEVARAVTDATGTYKAEFPVTDKGAYDLRVRVQEDGRKQGASATEAVMVLSPTRLSVKVPGLARTDVPLRIRGSITPGIDRQVVIERSVSRNSWESVAKTTTSDSGRFKFVLKGLERDTIRVRVRVPATEFDTEAASPTSKVVVEDYEAAGRRYLEIVEEGNQISTQWNNAAGFELARETAFARDKAQAELKMVEDLRAYRHWPADVQDWVLGLAEVATRSADYNTQLSQARSEDEWDDVPSPGDDDWHDELVVRIRDLLGLPPRSA